MSFSTNPTGANLYTQGFGSRPENVEIPVISNVVPASNNINFPVGKRWIDSAANSEYVLTSISTAGNVSAAVWTLLGTSGGALNTLSDDASATATPSAGNIQLAGTANQIATTAGAAEIVFSLIGPYTPSSYTAHGVLIGEGSSSVVATAAGTNGQVLIGATGADPAFASITSSGSTLTLTGGANSLNIDVTAPLNVAHGGTGATTLTGVLTGNGASAVTANAVTNHGVLIGGASNAVSSLAVASTGSVLMGSTGANPAFTGSPSFSGSVTAGTGLTVTSGGATVTAGGLTVTAGGAGITGTTNINTTGAAVTSIGTGGTGAVNIGNATGNTAVTGSLTASTSLTATLGNITATNGNLVLNTAGNKLSVKSGANASIGTSAAMTAGSVTVSTTAVKTASIIFLTVNTPGGTQGILSAPSASIVDSTSFVINSDNALDTSTVNWWIIN